MARMKPRELAMRDAIVDFQCSSPGHVQVLEIVGGDILRHVEVPRTPDVVNEMEAKYIFYGRHADLAREQVMHGKSCEFSVFFREP